MERRIRAIFNRYSERAWSATIGFPWQTVDWVHNRLNTSCPVVVSRKEILLALNFICEYRAEDAAALTFNMSVNSYRDKLKATLTRIDNALPCVCFKLKPNN